MVCLVSTVCIFSMTLITYTYLSNMACPKRVVSWANTVCVHWTGHDALESALINDVATPPIVTSWIDIISLMFYFQSWPRNFNSKFPSEWFMSWFNWQWTVWFCIFSIWWADRDRRLWNAIGRSGSQDRIWADREWIVSGIGPCFPPGNLCVPVLPI